MKKFTERLDTAVFTTRFVLRENEIIQYIYHHKEDGTWEFIGSTEAKEDSDYLVVALDEIIQYDNTVLAVSDLLPGKKAVRTSKEVPWRILDI